MGATPADTPVVCCESAGVKAEQILSNRRLRSLVFSPSTLPSDPDGTRKAAPFPITKKRACRRLDAAAPERDYPQVRVRIAASEGSKEPESPDAQRRGRLPSPRPNSDQGQLGIGGPPDGGRSRAQPCPRCIAGESGQKASRCFLPQAGEAKPSPGRRARRSEGSLLRL
ncbi:uncharacterized protein C10orf143 homolog isoform X2 [Cervus elaphus]|uniref:uncharacterized protein C10orf143 homolog isoform X2 n=1 Tax=Cervus elaphus TaxID=9860 RepID=UPI001CC2A9CC|nr:uncharacterized protein C10orf143 homolog isoform X2 [Cervus elaphus]